MENFLRYRKSLLFLLSLISLGLGSGLYYLKMDYSPQYLFRTQSKKFQQLEEYRKVFAKEEHVIMVIFQGENLFTAKTLDYYKKLKKKIEHTDGLQVRSLLDYFPKKILPKELKKRALNTFWMKKFFISEDGNTLTFFVDLDPHVEKIDHVLHLISKLETIFKKIPPFQMKVYITGVPYVRKEIVQKLIQDQSFFIPLSVLLFIVVLFFLYRRISFILIPFGAILLAQVWILGLMGWCGKSIDIINNILPTLIFTIAISDSIHLLSRYVQEISKGVEQKKAILTTFQHLKKACFFTSFTTAIGFASLLLADLDILRDFGLYSAIGVMFAYFTTIIFVPIGLSFTKPITPSDLPKTSTWEMKTINQWILGKPLLIFFVSLIFFGSAIYFGAKVEVDNHVMEALSKENPVYKAGKIVEEKLSGMIPMAVLFKWKKKNALENPKLLLVMDEISTFLRQQDMYVISPSDFIKESYFLQESAFLNPLALKTIPKDSETIAKLIQIIEKNQAKIWNRFVVYKHHQARILAFGKDVGAKKALRFVRKLEKKLPSYHIPGVEITLNDVAPVAAPALQSLVRDLRDSLFFAFGVIFITLTILFRSLKLGLVSLLPNVFPLAMALGYLGVMGADLQSTTIFVFPIALGLAVDDTIHFLSRYRELIQEGKSIPMAIEETLAGTGKAIVFTTLLLGLGFLVLIFTNFPLTRQFAFLMEIIISTALFADIFLLTTCLLLFKVRT